MESVDDDRIKSRPLYSPIEIRENAAFHLFVEEQSVGDKQAEPSDLANLFEQCQSQVKSWLNPSAQDVLELSKGMAQNSEASKEFALALSSLPLAAHVYVAGTESFIWDVHNVLVNAGLLTEQISLMKPNSTVRRVFCTHCYTVMEDVTHTPVTCAGCQRPLLVRDHFSRVHGAYVGLNVNAEDENDIPEKEALK